MDIGTHADGLIIREECVPAVLTSSEKDLMELLETQVGARQVKKSELDDMPEFFAKKEMEAEVAETLVHVTEEVEATGMPKYANLLSTHFFFKINKSEDENRKLKARLVVHENKDEEKDKLRKDAIGADMTTTRMVLEFGMMMNFTFGVAGIKGTYMQSSPVHRDIFIITPSAYKKRHLVYWKLLALAYGVFDAGRQWLKTSDLWIIEDLGMHFLIWAHQVFIRRGVNGELKLIVAKQAEDLLAAGSEEAVTDFFEQMKKRFTAGK